MNALTGKIRIDFRADEPLYLQIVGQVEHLMQAGELVPGDQLPTVRELATELRINFNTVSRAYRLLDESGLISTQRGRGTFAWARPDEDTMRSLHQRELQELTLQYLGETARLGFSSEEVEAMFQQKVEARKNNNLPET